LVSQTFLLPVQLHHRENLTVDDILQDIKLEILLSWDLDMHFEYVLHACYRQPGEAHPHHAEVSA